MTFSKPEPRTQQVCSFVSHLPSPCTLSRNVRMENLPFHSGTSLCYEMSSPAKYIEFIAAARRNGKSAISLNMTPS